MNVDTIFYKICKTRDTLTSNKTYMHTKNDRSTCETAANEVITLGIMPVRIVLHVHPMPVIQEYKLIELNSFIHRRISLHFIHSSTKKGCTGGIIN